MVHGPTHSCAVYWMIWVIQLPIPLQAISLRPRVWYHLTVTHVKPSMLSRSVGTVKVFLNGEPRFQSELPYPASIKVSTNLGTRGPGHITF